MQTPVVKPSNGLALMTSGNAHETLQEVPSHLKQMEKIQKPKTKEILGRKFGNVLNAEAKTRQKLK